MIDHFSPVEYPDMAILLDWSWIAGILANESSKLSKVINGIKQLFVSV